MRAGVESGLGKMVGVQPDIPQPSAVQVISADDVAVLGTSAVLPLEARHDAGVR